MNNCNIAFWKNKKCREKIYKGEDEEVYFFRVLKWGNGS
jgi:hypothetical protein